MSDEALPAALGPYEVLARLSRGGMGEVLLGRRTGAHGFERLVALKMVLSEDSGADLRTMFLDEARLVAKLTHPAVAQVYDFGEDDGRLWLAMEYVAGVPLHVLAPAEPLIVARMVAEACRGLHAAHELRDRDGRPLNVVHRDISPDNLRLGFDGQVKVLDFGVALMRDRQQPVTQAGAIKGKLAYMSPEQVRGDVVDRRADVYALGVVLHELSTGVNLMSDADALASMGNRARAIAPPSTRVKGLPPAFDAVVMKALADDPEQRYASALELHDALVAVAPSASLERYATEMLGARAEQHRVWLQQVLAEQVPTALKPQAAQRLTVPDGPAPALAATEKSAGRPRWVGTVVGAAVGVAVLGGALAFLTYRQPPQVLSAPRPAPTPVAAVELDAGAGPEVDLTIGEPALDSRAAVARPKPAPPRPKAEPPAGPTPPPAPSGTATLQVVAGEAYGVVRLDGNVVGPTPQKLKVSAGRHLVEVLRPDTNEVQLSQKLELADGDVRRVVAP